QGAARGPAGKEAAVGQGRVRPLGRYLQHHGPWREDRPRHGRHHRRGASVMRPEKLEAVEEIKGHFEKGTAAVFLDYSGMTVAEVSALRSQFRAQGVTYKVLKNSLVRLALGDAPFVSKLKPVLKGMTAVAFSGEEPG